MCSMWWSSDVVMEFLDLFEKEPSLWDHRNAAHKDRHKGFAAWKRIQDQISVTCSYTELKKKKAALLATYRKLAKKVRRSKKSKEVYKPEWFAYEKMASFFDQVYQPRSPKRHEKHEVIWDDEGDSSSDNYDPPDPLESMEIKSEGPDTVEVEKVDHIGATSKVSEVAKDAEPPTKRKRITDSTTELDGVMDDDYCFMKQAPVKWKATKDESSLFCDLLCFKLRSLDEGRRQIAMHQINNIMFDSSVMSGIF